MPVVGLSASDACPRPESAKDGRWDVAPVFPEAPGERLPASMKRLCVYTWVGCGARDTAALPLSGLVYAADDPPVVQALGAAEKARADVVIGARARLSRAADALSPLPDKPAGAPVFVGVPDSSPSSPQSPDDIPADVVSHGFDVAWVARFLACPNGSLRPCLGRVRTDLALGRGGGRGARADLAASIVRLVRAWKTKDGRSAPLVIPIASGWEPAAERALPWRKGPPADAGASAATDADSLPAPESPSLSPGARAVLDALHFAACHGVLVLAAAGNDPGYREPPKGAMLPAAWESLSAPAAAACKAWFGDDSASRLAPSKAAYTPLVHAVGGVDDRDHPVLGTRDKGLPRLVAPASMVAAYPDDPADAGYARVCAGADAGKGFVCDRTAARTGTSMAVAVTAGIAAVVWSYHPTWSGHDVAAALHAGGVPLGEKADVSLTPGKETIARVGLCSALAASCKGAPRGTCPERLTCAKLPAFAKGPRPSPFVPVRPGTAPLSLDLSGAGPDPALVCPGCALHTGQDGHGCELAGTIPAALFQTGRVAKVQRPGLDVYDGSGQRLGFVDEPGFRPQAWTGAEPGDQAIRATAASCAKAAQVVLRLQTCADAACTNVVPLFRELPVVP